VPTDTVCVIGEHEVLGAWDPKRARQCHLLGGAWFLRVPLEVGGSEFKLLAGQAWEPLRTNRRFPKDAQILEMFFGVEGPVSDSVHKGLRLEVLCEDTQPGESLCVLGSHPLSWDVALCPRLVTNSSSFPCWYVDLPVISPGSEFKLAIEQHGVLRWEPIDGNRLWPTTKDDDYTRLVYGVPADSKHNAILVTNAC